MAVVFGNVAVTGHIARHRQVRGIRHRALKDHAGSGRTLLAFQALRTLDARRPLDALGALISHGPFRPRNALVSLGARGSLNQAEIDPLAAVPEPEMAGVFGDPGVAHLIADRGQSRAGGHRALEHHSGAGRAAVAPGALGSGGAHRALYPRRSLRTLGARVPRAPLRPGRASGAYGTERPPELPAVDPQRAVPEPDVRGVLGDPGVARRIAGGGQIGGAGDDALGLNPGARRALGTVGAGRSGGAGIAGEAGRTVKPARSLLAWLPRRTHRAARSLRPRRPDRARDRYAARCKSAAAQH